MNINNEWFDAISNHIDTNELNAIIDKATLKYEEGIVYPPRHQVFRAINELPIKKVKVVILGQDPYHQFGQANGLAFSVNKGLKLPPSLRNIYKELDSDTGIINTSGDLTSWLNQGVLLLNTSLTVFEGKPKSHDDLKWSLLTDAIIKVLNKQKQPIVFILWGSDARKKKKLLNNPNHLIVESPHPSPLSAYRGFFGSKPFSKTNDFLETNNCEIINWKTGD